MVRGMFTQHVMEVVSNEAFSGESSQKLLDDALRDGANGAPPMHPDMRAGEWHRIFTAAWDRLHRDMQQQRVIPIHEYGLTSPAEFFAVCSETFFEAPQHMREHMPHVYRLLCQFYRQEPVSSSTESG